MEDKDKIKDLEVQVHSLERGVCFNAISILILNILLLTGII